MCVASCQKPHPHTPCAVWYRVPRFLAVGGRAKATTTTTTTTVRVLTLCPFCPQAEEESSELRLQLAAASAGSRGVPEKRRTALDRGESGDESAPGGAAVKDDVHPAPSVP